MGFLQVDSINVLERAHHLTLHSRFDGYRPATLKTLLERDRRLFEHWTHDASVIPIEFYPFWKPRFTAHASRPIKTAWWVKRLGGRDPEELLREVRAEVRTRGPLRARDVALAPTSAGSWWNWHPGKAALEHLWRTGELAIEGREGFEKRYDLADRVHPDAARTVGPTTAEFVEWSCVSALERLGVATPTELAAFWRSIPLEDAREWCRDACRSGRVERVSLDDLDGRRRAGVAIPEARRWARMEPWSDEFRILCPFDPVIRDRRRLERRFDFAYRFEAFVPAHRRAYGYYVMPVLHGDRFVARVDPRYDRPNRRIDVRGPWWESGRGGREDRRRIARALDRLSRCLEAREGWRWIES